MREIEFILARWPNPYKECLGSQARIVLDLNVLPSVSLWSGGFQTSGDQAVEEKEPLEALWQTKVTCALKEWREMGAVPFYIVKSDILRSGPNCLYFPIVSLSTLLYIYVIHVRTKSVWNKRFHIHTLSLCNTLSLSYSYDSTLIYLISLISDRPYILPIFNHGL